MTSKLRTSRHRPTRPGDDVETLYLRFLRAFYEKGDRKAAEPIAARLEALMAERPDVAASIRGEEIRSLVAELRGDFVEAIHSREAEIRKILELHTLAKDAATREHVFRQYDYADVADRLDLLANLYAEQGELTRAAATLHESRQFCLSHGVPFDGQDLLDEIERDERVTARSR
jgi:hypothetical protein